MNAPATDPDFIPAEAADLRRATIHMAACINLADWRFIKLIAAMDRTRAWRDGGFLSLAHWLDYHCGLGGLAARERIRVGRKLVKLPHIDAAFRDGELSYSKVRAITRVACPDTDRMLLALAKTSSTEALERLVRTYERTAGETAPNTQCYRARSLAWEYDEGMLVITARLPAEQGAVVVQALQQVVDGKAACRDAYWQERYESLFARRDDKPEAVAEEESDVPADVSAETVSGPAGANGLPSETVSPADDEPDLPEELLFHLSTPWQRQADALVDLAERALAAPAADTGPHLRRRPHEVVLHIDREALARGTGDVATRFSVEPGWHVDESAARRIGCDAELTEIIDDPRHFDIRPTRPIVPPELKQALLSRDRHCRFPGCSHQRDLHVHFIRHWFDGGEAELGNLVLLCHRHHHLAHLGEFHIARVQDEVTFTTRQGEVLSTETRFPDVSAETLPSGNAPARPLRRSVFENHSDRQVARMIRHRERWGRSKGERFWQWLQKSLLMEDAASVRTEALPRQVTAVTAHEPQRTSRLTDSK